MNAELLDAAAARSLVAARLGADPCSEEGLYDLLRAEVGSRGSAARAPTLRRVHELLAPLWDVEPDAVNTACEALVRAGDLLALPVGGLAATPVRLVQISGEVLLAASMTTGDAARWFGEEFSVGGIVRRMRWDEALLPRLEDL